MILACGTCTHWILWTAFPAATPWAVAFAAWFLVLSAVATLSRVALTAVPRLPAAVLLVLVSLVLGVAVAGPVAGLWFAPSCLVGTASALRRASRPPARRTVLAAAAVAVLALGALWVRSTAAHRRLGPAERVLLLDGTPAWPAELRRVGPGDCATLARVAEKAGAARLVAAANRRLQEECSAGSRSPGKP